MAADTMPDQPDSASTFLGPDASADAVADSLRPEDRRPFQRAYRRALAGDEADAVRAVVDLWRGIALMQADPRRYAALVRRIAARNTGRPVPSDEPLAVTRRAASI